MTDTLFWVVLSLMMLVSVLLFVWPFIKSSNPINEKLSRDQLNKHFYRERMSEIAEEVDEGLIDNKDELTVELQQSLLDDIPDDIEKTTDIKTPKLAILAGVVFLVVSSMSLYVLMGDYSGVTRWQETAKRLPELSQRMMADADEPMSDQEMNDMTLALRTQLQTTPDDGMGWLLLGRIALANRDMMTAEGAMAKAYKLMPDDMDVKLGYAQSLMLSGDETNAATARGLLKEVIRQDHGNLQAMSLLAFEAFERGAFEEAAAAWSTMLKLLPENDPRAAMLTRSIQKANAQLNIGLGQSVTANIALADNVTLPSDGVLIVSVHSADGAPMPIAAKRLPLAKFPVSVVLTDSDSMIPERLLSSLPEVMLKARIDTDGNVMTKDGDWFGESQTLKLGEQGQILINNQY